MKNVDTQARIIAYDIRELGEQLMPYINLLIYLEKFQSMEHFK